MWSFRRFEIACIAGFPLFWVTLLVRTSVTLPLALLAVVLGLVLADFISGLSHWAFDTWFTVATPVVGRAFVRTFREHHVDPSAICRHDFIETNGSNALAGIISVAIGHGFGSNLGRATLLVTSLMLSVTSQLHQWAHAEQVPRAVVWLQRARLVLTKEGHAAHHAAPFNRAYCITFGWLDGVLHHTGFFRALERLITAATGARPHIDSGGSEVNRDAHVVVASAK